MTQNLNAKWINATNSVRTMERIRAEHRFFKEVKLFAKAEDVDLKKTFDSRARDGVEDGNCDWAKIHQLAKNSTIIHLGDYNGKLNHAKFIIEEIEQHEPFTN